MYGDFGLDSNKHSSSEQLSILTQILICYITESAHTWHSWKLLALGLWVRAEKLWQRSVEGAHCCCQHSDPGHQPEFLRICPSPPHKQCTWIKIQFHFYFYSCFQFLYCILYITIFLPSTPLPMATPILLPMSMCGKTRSVMMFWKVLNNKVCYG